MCHCATVSVCHRACVPLCLCACVPLCLCATVPSPVSPAHLTLSPLFLLLTTGEIFHTGDSSWFHHRTILLCFENELCTKLVSVWVKVGQSQCLLRVPDQHKQMEKVEWKESWGTMCLNATLGSFKVAKMRIRQILLVSILSSFPAPQG